MPGRASPVTRAPVMPSLLDRYHFPIPLAVRRA